jgi:Holliday junction resolvase RusA-like endonuclease
MSAYVGQNQQLNAYKEAVREELGEQELQQGEHTLYLYFWRNRPEYTTAQARTHRKHEADLTNLQKATEDALQGVLFANDRDVKEVHSVLMAQGPDVEPAIVIGICPYFEQPVPEAVLALMHDEPYVPDDETEMEQRGGVPF